MRQIWITKAGRPEVLQLKDAPDPSPGENEVVIDVKSAGINFADIMARLGVYQDAPDLPCVVGYEVAGVVESVGSKVTRLKMGDSVCALTRFGGYSTKIVVAESQAYPIPSGWSFEEASAMPVNYLTAYQLLVVMGSIRNGSSVLIHGAGGGVGTAATQIAKLYDATIYGTSSKKKHDYIRSNGVHHAIDYRNEDFVERINELTEDRGVEIVLDAIGGKHFSRSYDALRSTGRLLMYGMSSMAQSKRKSLWNALKAVVKLPLFKFYPVRLINENKGVLGVNIGHLWHERDLVTGWMQELIVWAEEGKIRPVVDTTFSFEEAPKAHHYIQDRKNLGKVCLVPE
ncbi:MAG: medium chain dehydrogenase/reductase family protein [Candidatus Marinimicrobia bacterium]|nr:medium chain dehydrogenase/reductase family protein [Candidatus Neomarinimicrobiota bacterium]MCF7828184.1 medium chain dehydrogenase/reductase family protein [Candidatus Neomarinimicrobiota bacterium]MCF7879641.1 medium chain dehydrogenase/reductase family protein [Candidatus Neomarinimicrobiota bacterium]